MTFSSGSTRGSPSVSTICVLSPFEIPMACSFGRRFEIIGELVQSMTLLFEAIVRPGELVQSMTLLLEPADRNMCILIV